MNSHRALWKRKGLIRMSIGLSTLGKRPFCEHREDAVRLFPWQSAMSHPRDNLDL